MQSLRGVGFVLHHDRDGKIPIKPKGKRGHGRKTGWLSSATISCVVLARQLTASQRSLGCFSPQGKWSPGGLEHLVWLEDWKCPRESIRAVQPLIDGNFIAVQSLNLVL